MNPEIARAFDAVAYLRDLDAEARADLATACAFRRVRAGVAVFNEGDPPAGIFLILEGRIKVVRCSSDGREQVLHHEGAGTTLAEVPVFDGGGYVGSAIAVEDSLVLFVERQALLAVLGRTPGSAVAAMGVLAARIRKLAAVVEDLSLRTVTERAARFLLQEMDRAGSTTFDLPPTREQLAAHLGTVREQASRALSHLRTIGAVDVDGRRVRVLDAERLRHLSGHPPARST